MQDFLFCQKALQHLQSNQGLSKKEFCFKKTTELNKDTDKFVSNKIGNFSLSEIQLGDNDNSEKYPLRIYGDGYSYDSSYEHKFVIFNGKTNTFELKEAKDLHEHNSQFMVLIEK